MIDPINSEATAAKADIVELAAWLVQSRHVAVADVVRRLEIFSRAAYVRGVDSVKRRKDSELD